jgi:hypothetical protein
MSCLFHSPRFDHTEYLVKSTNYEASHYIIPRIFLSLHFSFKLLRPPPPPRGSTVLEEPWPPHI